MRSSARWLVTVSTSVVVFGVCLWLFRFVSFSWMPHAESDRWVVATAFATVAATAVGWPLTRWAAGNEPTETSRKQFNLWAKVRGHGKSVQIGKGDYVGGDQHNVGRDRRDPGN